MEVVFGSFKADKRLSWKINLGRYLWYHSEDEQFLKVDLKHEGIEPIDEYDDVFFYKIIEIFINRDNINNIQEMLQFETKKFQWITITSLLPLLGFYDERSHPHLLHYTQQLTFELSHELESCDSYSHWAIFILTFLPQSPAKSDYIKNLLYKNSENLEYLEFLREKLNVPEYHIHEARAQYYLDRKEYHKAFVQLMNGKIYERAHEVLMEIAP